MLVQDQEMFYRWALVRYASNPSWADPQAPANLMSVGDAESGKILDVIVLCTVVIASTCNDVTVFSSILQGPRELKLAATDNV